VPDRLRVSEALELYAAFYEDPEDIGTLIFTLGLDKVRRSPFSKLSGARPGR